MKVLCVCCVFVNLRMITYNNIIYYILLRHQLSFGQLQQFCCFETKVHALFFVSNPEHGAHGHFLYGQRLQ